MTTIHVWKGTQLKHNHEFEVLNKMDDILQNVEVAASSTVQVPQFLVECHIHLFFHLDL